MGFGDASAAGLAVMGRILTADKANETPGTPYHAAVQEALREQVFVDDVYGRGPFGDNMQGFREEMEKAAAEGGFVLKEWFKSGDDATIKMLGYTWDCKNDLLFIQANIVKGALDRGQKVGETLTVENVQDALSTSLTKRDLLSIIAQIYDPLGLCAPVTNSLKVLFSQSTLKCHRRRN